MKFIIGIWLIRYFWRGNKIEECDVLFINPPYQRRKGSGVTIPLGLGYLASYLRLRRFTPTIFDCAPFFDSLDDQSLKKLNLWLLDRLSKIKPRLAIGIGPCTISAVPATIRPLSFRFATLTWMSDRSRPATLWT